MDIKNLHRFLIIKYSICGIVIIGLFTMVFLIYNTLDNSLNQNDKTLNSITTVRDSVKTLNILFNSYTIEPNVQKKYVIKKSLDELFSGIKNNRNIEQISSDLKNQAVKHFSDELRILKIELQNITVQYRSLSAEEKPVNQQPFIEPIKSGLNKIDMSLSNLGALIIAHQRNSISGFNKYNILIWLAALLSLHMLIIFVFKPVSKTILSVVTEQKEQKEEALSSARAKSDYLATLSHQIRTPLNGVLGLSGLLLETNLNKDQREYLELIKDSGENLLQIINDIFDYSRIESGQLELDELYFNVHQNLDEIVDTFLPKCREKKLELLCIIEPDVPEFILGDSQRLMQCISNLVNNSIKFTRAGEILIRVNVLNNVENRFELQFSVSDTGIGIPEAKMKTLFNPSLQSEAPVSRRFEGTGLGLAIVSRLVHLMNGRIWVESEMNKGTTFFMAIYFQTDKKGMTIWDEKDISVLSNKHVLILDPSENSRKMISLQCHDWGMQSRSVQTKEELIKILSVERNVDFILADYELAKNPEYDITEILDDVNKKARFRIIYMLNNTLINPDNKQHHFIHKPIRKLQLLNILLKSGFEQADNKTAEENNLINRKNNLNILLAEDNVINQKLFERMISQIGYPIDIAQDGVNAVKMASLKKYDLIFMDLQMPEMDGLEATRTIMRNAREPKPNIIAMTANIQKKDKEQCFEAGMIDYLAKPVSYLKIKSILDYWQNVKLQKPA